MGCDDRKSDGNIFLGIEGKAEILTGSRRGRRTRPLRRSTRIRRAISCYLVKDGVIVRQNVVTGISSDMDVEIKEGVSEGDTVVISSDMDLMEGLQVKSCDAVSKRENICHRFGNISKLR